MVIMSSLAPLHWLKKVTKPCADNKTPENTNWSLSKFPANDVLFLHTPGSLQVLLDYWFRLGMALVTVYPKRYVHRSVLLRFVVVWYSLILPKSSRVTSLALGQSYDCPSACEATLKNIVHTYTHSTIKHIKIVHISHWVYCTYTSHRSDTFTAMVWTTVSSIYFHSVLLSYTVDFLHNIHNRHPIAHLPDMQQRTPHSLPVRCAVSCVNFTHPCSFFVAHNIVLYCIML